MSQEFVEEEGGGVRDPEELEAVIVPDEKERGRVLDRVAAAGRTPAADGGAPAVRDPSGNLVVLAVAGEADLF